MQLGQTGESANAATALRPELSVSLPFQKQLKFSFGSRQRRKHFTYIKRKLLKDIHSTAQLLWMCVACHRNVEFRREKP